MRWEGDLPAAALAFADVEAAKPSDDAPLAAGESSENEEGMTWKDGRVLTDWGAEGLRTTMAVCPCCRSPGGRGREGEEV